MTSTPPTPKTPDCDSCNESDVPKSTTTSGRSHSSLSSESVASSSDSNKEQASTSQGTKQQEKVEKLVLRIVKNSQGVSYTSNFKNTPPPLDKFQKNSSKLTRSQPQRKAKRQKKC